MEEFLLLDAHSNLLPSLEAALAGLEITTSDLMY